MRSFILFAITKDFKFEYAHRVYTQDVDPKLSLGMKGDNPCRHLHGHSGTISIALAVTDLDERGFVLDYKELGFLKEIINNNFDHKTIIGLHDPILEKSENHFFTCLTDPLGFIHLVPLNHQNPSIEEFFEGFTVLDIIPTSENLAKFVYKLVEKELKTVGLNDKINLVSVTWSETESSKALYTEGY